MKDFQKGKVYLAENSAGIFDTDKLNLDEAQSFVNLWLKNKWLLTRYPFMKNKQIKIKNGYGKAWGTNNTICLPPWACKKGILAHEFAHVIHKNKWADEIGHGWRFVNIYLLCSKYFVSRDYAKRLKNECKRLKVKFYESHTKARY